MKKIVLTALLATTVGLATAQQPILNTFCTDYRHAMFSSCMNYYGDAQFCKQDDNLVAHAKQVGTFYAVDQFVRECLTPEADD